MIRLLPTLREFTSSEEGTTLVEFAIATSLFLLLVFGLIDFARLGFSRVLAEKATERAVRMAVVRPAVCPNLPTTNARGVIGTLSVDVPNGTRCTERANLCKEIQKRSCLGSADNPTVADIWPQVSPLLPTGAAPENLSFTYHYDPALNRVGAPYMPIVTVELADLQFDFISPLGALVRAAGGPDDTTLGQSFLFPSMSASLPAETIR